MFRNTIWPLMMIRVARWFSFVEGLLCVKHVPGTVHWTNSFNFHNNPCFKDEELLHQTERLCDPHKVTQKNGNLNTECLILSNSTIKIGPNTN